MIRTLPAVVKPRNAPSTTRPPDGLKDFGELTSVQRGLFGKAGAKGYESLSSEQRAIFLLISTKLAEDGIDLTGLVLEDPKKTIRPNRILFAKGPKLASFQRQLAEGKADDRFVDDKPFALFHPGRSAFGARENTAQWSVQIGIGKDGAFADVDRFNPWAGVKAYLGHTAELLVPGKPEAEEVARRLRLPIFDLFA